MTYETNVVLKCQNISKSFSGVSVLNNITYSLPQGSVLGLVGENGAGKSTLMNILGGVFQPDTGDMVLRDRSYAPETPLDAQQAGIAFIHQELNLFTNLTIAENFFITSFPWKKWFGIPYIDKKSIDRETEDLLSRVGLYRSPNTVVEALSPAEKQLVEIAKALRLDAQVIIFDEPTTSLTAHETTRLFEIINQLRSQSRAMIYISHQIEDIIQLADQILILRDGEMAGYGPKETFALESIVSKMVGRDIDQFFPPRTTQPTERILLQVERLSQPGILSNITFCIRQGEVVGFFGLVGSGRSEMARMIFGLDQFETGIITFENQWIKHPSPHRCKQLRIAFLTEDRHKEGLLLESGILDNTSLAALPEYSTTPVQWIQKARLRDDARRSIESTKVRYRSLDQPVKTLSGGNQQKVVISKWLMTNPKLLILDEPTRGIDVGAKYEIYTLINQLVENGSSILFISSEIEELLGMCDRILVMNRGTVTAEFIKSQFDRETILRAALEQ